VPVRSQSEEEGFKLICLNSGRFDSESSGDDKKPLEHHGMGIHRPPEIKPTLMSDWVA